MSSKRARAPASVLTALKKKRFRFSAFLGGLITSVYALLGTLYLMRLASQSVQDRVGLLGTVTRHIPSLLTIQPGLALYGLLNWLGLPVIFFYGLIGGVGAPLHAGLPLLIGALFSRYYFSRKFGKIVNLRKGTLHDISAGGCAVETSDMIPPIKPKRFPYSRLASVTISMVSSNE